MNRERGDEAEAKEIVESVLGLRLEHADIDGGVDYRSTDECHAVEVTRITDGRKRAGREALNTSRRTGTSNGELRTCWLAIAPDTQHGLKYILQRLHPALVELEAAGETRFERQHAAVHVIRQGPLARPYRSLLSAGVTRASAVPDHAHRVHDHQVILSLGGGGTSSGSDEALDLLANTLSKKKDNPKKLKASGLEHRHLFVWLDDDTPSAIAGPLSREAPSCHEGFDVPTTPPALDPAVTHLWVVHEGSRLAWLWDGLNWRALRDV